MQDLNDEAWTKYREKAAESYDGLNYSRQVQSSVMHASHRLLEKEYDHQVHFGRVLELGAGTGEHLQFVRHTFDEYILTDSDPKTIELAKMKHASTHDGRVGFDVQTANNLTYSDNTFDRLVAVHLLEHIYKPHLALKEWYRVLKHGGVLSILIPTDPGLTWRLGRCLGPRKHTISQGIPYDYIMAREHVNSCNNLIAMLRHYFPKQTSSRLSDFAGRGHRARFSLGTVGSKEAWWPLLIPSIDLNLFFAFHTSISKQEVGQ